MKVFFLFCVIGVAFLIAINSLSNKTPPAPPDPDADFMMIAVYAVKKAQRNPDSFVLETAVLTEKAACLEWRGQNGFGGMNRGRSVVARDRKYALNDHEDGFRSAWNRDCATKNPGRDLTQHMQGQLRYNPAMAR